MTAASIKGVQDERSLSLLQALGIGVGAIVGGGILALAGVAFATTGPSSILAFALNGLIALLTALTFAEMATSFPINGGTYTFAKKVLSVEAAFMVGWVVWFASIVAAALYALGFGSFAKILLLELWPGALPAFLAGSGCETALGVVATAFYSWGLIRSSASGGQWETLGKMIVFVLLIVAGLWALPQRPLVSIEDHLTPFFTSGAAGLVTAMGYTFVALQGFDLIAAVGGEVKDPSRNLPRAMLGSLGIALAVYLPLLFILTTVGVPEGSSVGAMAGKNPEALVAVAAQNFLGRTGFWLVLVAGLLSMLSALQANLLAASRFAQAMADDRNLPERLRELHPARKTPMAAVLTTAALVVAVLLLVPSVAVAGAVASLIFLLSFTLTHWTSILARRRGGAEEGGFQLPWFPLIPVLGGLACLGLASFQSVVVPAAGLVAGVWLAIGLALYLLAFSQRARVADAAAEGLDPQLMRLRGRAPIVLVPIANPASARSLVRLASALAPRRFGRVSLLYVVQDPERWDPKQPPPQLVYAQQVLSEALTASFASNLQAQALTTIASEPWLEIGRVAKAHRSESLLLGLGELDSGLYTERLSRLLEDVPSNLVILRTPPEWRLEQVKRILVPVGGRRDQSSLRARLLSSLCRSSAIEVIYLCIIPENAPREAGERAQREIQQMAEDETGDHSKVEICKSDDVTGTVVARSASTELIILGLGRPRQDAPIFGEIPKRIARETAAAILMIHQKE